MADITPTEWESRIMTAFNTFWDTVNPTVPIASPNDFFDRAKVTVDSFVEYSITGAPEGQTSYSSSVANNHFSREGVITFISNVKLRGTVAPATNLLNDIGLFYETAVIQGGYFRNLGVPVDIGSDGAWYQMSLSSNWLYFTDRSSTPVVIG